MIFKMARKNVLIEGWRGINHSYAMVNQFQLLELRKREDLCLFHRDLPFYRGEWNESRNASGFSAPQRALIDSIPRHRGEPIDAIYRISYPYRIYGGESRKILCFGTSEYQRLGPEHFYRGSESNAAYSNNAVKIITPSHWSKAGFVNYGFAPEEVVVIPHGVDPSTFYPCSKEERIEGRKLLGLPLDKFLFLNVGAMTLNKGIEKLVRGFSAVVRKHPQVMLLLKDQSNLYGIRGDSSVKQVQDLYPDAIDAEVLGSMGLISANLTLAELRTLYSACDAYVAPYRAEGFNLPPLEAAACGVPIIVTDGGPTDDYCHRSFALKVSSTKRSDENLGNYLEPDLDSLIHCMETLLENRAKDLDWSQAAAWIGENFSWASIVRRLAPHF